MSASKNYLSRLPDEDRREHTRRQTNKVGTVYYLLHGVRGYSKQSCRMDNISENGCHVCRLLSEPIPDFVYFVLEGLEAKFPCAVVERSEDGLHLKFMTNLPTELVDRIADKRFPKK
ncbi:PilZ domain-containing protein [uncultured Hoeflea sp.]|uniref:PilZ domain-containing protein n=1 Tax=uncultured Hoeflea sp. TaxID=538666 RepID=UPI0030DC4779